MAQLIDGIVLGTIISLLLYLFSGGDLFSVWISPMVPAYLLQVDPGYFPRAGDWWWGGYFTTFRFPFLADLHLAWPAPLLWGIYAGYYGAFHYFKGQTPGKMMKGLAVVGAREGKHRGAVSALLRWAGYGLSLLPLGAGILFAAADTENRTLHDKLAGTKVVRFTGIEN